MVLLLALVCITVFCSDLFAQTPSAADMKNIRIDELSDDQIRAYYSQAQTRDYLMISLKRLPWHKE